MMEKDNLRREECGEFLESLSAYLDGELTAGEAEKIRSHIDNCAECRAVYERLAALSADIKSIETEIPEELHGRIMNAVKGAGKKKSTLQSRLRRYGLWIGAGVAAMLCLVLIGSPIFNGGMGMDLAKNMNVAICADEDEANCAAYSTLLADGAFVKTEAAQEVELESIEMSVSTCHIEAYYSAMGNDMPTSVAEECEISADDFYVEVEKQLDGSETDSGENELLSKLQCVTETEMKKPEITPIPNFFPERGKLTPIKIDDQ